MLKQYETVERITASLEDDPLSVLELLQLGLGLGCENPIEPNPRQSWCRSERSGLTAVTTACFLHLLAIWN